ncbi:MAG: sodium:calcium antiporter, partial [Bacteroidetes bacterium]
MLLPTLFLLGGFALLYVGAEALVRGGAALALRLGLSPLVVGLTVVAFGTSSPELVVSLKAALDGTSGLALGNVVGSNVANIALILGTSALIRPVAIQSQLI